MKWTRDEADGSFTITGDQEEMRKFRDGLSGAYGSDDGLVEELDTLLDASAGRELDFRLEPGDAAEIVDFMECDEDEEILRVGLEMRAEMDRVTSEAMAKLERES